MPSLEGYELLASGNGRKLELWNGVAVRRPESAACWPWTTSEKLPVWQGDYEGERAAGGSWRWLTPLPDPCLLRYGSLRFLIRPTASKHLGLFPEQTTNWDWIAKVLSEKNSLDRPPRILNLFGYTGGATLAAAQAGASVTHVDASRAMVSWCSENARLSGLGSAAIRYVVEDAMKYLQREIRRGNYYDGVILDPPSYGRGRKGELWKLSEHLPQLLASVREVFSENPLFLLLNTYSDLVEELEEEPPTLIHRLFGSTCETVDLALRGTLDGLEIPCGTSHRWLA